MRFLLCPRQRTTHEGWAAAQPHVLRRRARSLRFEDGRDRFAFVEERVGVIPGWYNCSYTEALTGLDQAQESDRHAILLGMGGLDEPLPAHALRRQGRQDAGQPLLAPADEGCAGVDEPLIRAVE